jgi:hypothetical protein
LELPPDLGWAEKLVSQMDSQLTDLLGDWLDLTSDYWWDETLESSFDFHWAKLWTKELEDLLH